MTKSYDNGSGLQIKTTKNNLDAMVKSLLILADVEVLVGFPEDTTIRDADPADTAPRDITNASLAYIHDNGAPEQNIPARPFMMPGIESAKDAVTAKLSEIITAVSQGRSPDVVERGLTQVGLIAKLAIQNKINEGIPPPLAASTLRARARKGRKGAQAELNSRGQGNDPGMVDAKPLVDTGQMRNAVNYVIRSRRRRTKDA